MGGKKQLAVVAIGGNALIRDRDHQAIPDQYEAAALTVQRIADMIEAGWNVIVTHGNGPQMGYILRRSELSIHEVAPVPMDYAGADLQGAIGYMFVRAFRNEFRKRGTPTRASGCRDGDPGRRGGPRIPRSDQTNRLAHGRGDSAEARRSSGLDGQRRCGARLAAGRAFAAAAAK